MFWSAQHFQPTTSILVWERVVKGLLGLGAADPLEEQRGEKLVAELAEMLDTHLADRVWISGDGLTLADFAVAAPLSYIEAARLPVTQLGNIEAWLGRMQQLEAWKKTAA
jgi:glutathione S-transferase